MGCRKKKKKEERKGEKKQQQKIRTITKNENYNKHRIAADTLEKIKVCLKWPLEGKTRLPIGKREKEKKKNIYIYIDR